MLQLNNGLADFVTLTTSANKQKLVYLVDTEAHVSIIKKSALDKNVLVNNKEIIKMKGITNEKQVSLGSVIYKIYVRKIAIEHKFHVVTDNFPMPSHGILGKDFLKPFRCTVDYDKMSLTIRPNEEIMLKVPLQTNFDDNLTAIPPNSEVFKLFRLTSNSLPCVIEA